MTPGDYGADASSAPGLPGVSAAARPKITDAILHDLRQAIAEGQLVLGSRLPSEKELAREFGVSQATIREVLRALEAMGLVDVRHGIGVFVARDTQKYVSTALHTLIQVEHVDLIDALEVRAVLGSLSAQQAVRNATSGDIDAVKRATEQCANATDVASISKGIVDFQLTFAAGAHNPLLYSIESFLIRLLMTLQLIGTQGRGAAHWKEQSSTFDPDRRRMADLLADRDEDGVIAAFRDYMDSQREFFGSHAELFAAARLADPRVASLFASIGASRVDV